MPKDHADGQHNRPCDPVASAAQPASIRPGRKRDHTRDGAILEAAIDVLAEAGYVGMTMDMVAQRARAGKATLYRRWQSKSELVREAVATMQDGRVTVDQLPDTGSIRGDLLALFEPPSTEQAERRLRVMAGIASMLAYDAAFAEMGDAAIVEPWAQASRAVIRRGIERGEVNAGAADIDMLARIMPSMAICRALIQRRSADRQFLVALVDGALMPALRGVG